MRVDEEHSVVRWARNAAVVMTVASVAAVGACGGESADEEEAGPAAEDAASAVGEGAADDDPRVFFVQPSDGDTVQVGTVEARFGSENVEVAAVPAEFDAPREGVIHYHLGFDTECLPPDTVIPQADPWIHFGDGSSSIELQIPEAGDYLLTVQAGNDEHVTIEGLCETIEVTAVPGDQG